MSGPWIPIHRVGRDPIYFGRSGDNRFDAPSGEYGVLYVALDTYGAFVETLGHDTGSGLVTATALRARDVTTLSVQRPLRLVDLSGPGLARIGADQRLCTAEYRVAQRWASALWEHPDRPDGICYRARHDPSRLCAAIFDQAADALRLESAFRNLADPEYSATLADLLDTYGLGLLDDAG